MKAARLLLHEKGQILPVLLVLVVALLGGGIMLFQVGRAGDLRAEAASAADAAALAGVHNIEDQLTEMLVTQGYVRPDQIVDSLVRDAASDYAERNGARLTSYERVGFEVLVEVETVEALEGRDAERVASEGSAGTSKARARLEVTYAPLPPGLTEAFGYGNNAIPPAELRRVADAAGIERVPASSALVRYSGTCESGGVDVANLTDQMKVAILKAEELIGPLYINSAFRTIACQERLWNTVTGPVAPPGRSLHNYGLAIDVANWQALASVADEVGLCQPLPTNDAVHFSWWRGPECGGVAGAPGSAPYGGTGRGFVEFEAILVPLDGD